MVTCNCALKPPLYSNFCVALEMWHQRIFVYRSFTILLGLLWDFDNKMEIFFNWLQWYGLSDSTSSSMVQLNLLVFVLKWETVALLKIVFPQNPVICGMRFSGTDPFQAHLFVSCRSESLQMQSLKTKRSVWWSQAYTRRFVWPIPSYSRKIIV